MADQDDDDRARRETRGSMEIVRPGIPSRFAAPRVPLSAPELDSTPPEPFVVRKREGQPPPSAQRPLHEPHRAREQTLTGIAPPAPRSAPQPAPRSMPPSPSMPAPVSVSSDGVRLRWSGLRKALPWVLTGLGFTGCSVTGFFTGLRAEGAVVAGILETERDHAKRLVTLETTIKRHEERLDEQANAQQAEATSNRAERATAQGKLLGFAADLEQVKASTPKIQGLKPRP